MMTIVRWLHAPQLLGLRLRGALPFEMLKVYVLGTYDHCNNTYFFNFQDWFVNLL